MMRIGIIVVGAASFSMTAIGSAFAGCDVIAAHGIYDTSDQSSVTEQASSFRRLFCEQHFSSAAEASSFSTSAAIPIEGIPVELGFDQDNSSWQKSYAAFCDDTAYASTFRQQLESNIKTISAAVIDNLRRCVEAPGVVHAWIEPGPGTLKFSFLMRYIPAGQGKLPKVLNFVVEDATCVEEPTQNQEIGPAPYEVACSRASENDNVKIIFNADTFLLKDTPLTLLAVELGPPPNDSCETAVLGSQNLNVNSIPPPGPLVNGLGGPEGAHLAFHCNSLRPHKQVRITYTGRLNVAHQACEGSLQESNPENPVIQIFTPGGDTIVRTGAYDWIKDSTGHDNPFTIVVGPIANSDSSFNEEAIVKCTHPWCGDSGMKPTDANKSAVSCTGWIMGKIEALPE